MLKAWCRGSLQVLLVLGVFIGAWLLASDIAMAQGTVPTAKAGGIASLAENVQGNLSALAKLITGGSYIAGFGFILASIFKFKSHKDNPTQIPVGTPIALLFIGAAMVFLPSVIGSTGNTVFGSTGTAGNIGGVSTLPAGAGGGA